MSGPAGINPMNAWEEGEDAALVDSFFLPGGILDPDDEEEKEVPGIPSFANAKVSRVPSNPWSEDYNGNVLGPNSIEEPSLPTQPQHEGLGTSDAVSQPTVRPPPGFDTDTDRINPINASFVYGSANGPTGNEQMESHVFNVENSMYTTNNNMSLQVGPGDPENVASPAAQFQDRVIQRPHRKLDTNQDQEQPPLSVIIYSSEGNDTDGQPSDKLEREVVVASSEPPRPPGLPSTVEMNGSSGDAPEDDTRNHDNDDVRDETDESMRSDSSIPLELLSVRGIYKGDSITSSLSASTCGDDDDDDDEHEENPNVIDSDDEEDEDEEEEVEASSKEAGDPQAVQVENGAKHEKKDGNPASERLDAKRPTEKSYESNKWQLTHTFLMLCRRFLLALSSWSLAVMRSPYTFLLTIQAFILRSVLNSTVLIYFSQTTSTIASQRTKMATTFHEASQWMVDAKDISTALISKLISALRISLATITKTLILVASFLFQVWKFALIEAVEESNVAICYLVFYFMPFSCSLLMDLFNIPHWTPHLMTSMAVFSLCSQVKAGHLHMEDVSIFKLAEMSGNRKSGAKSSELSSIPKENGHQGENHRPRDERACKTILRILRFVLPTFFLADGFSSEFGTIMGVSGSSRLTTAFMMSLVRKNLVSSPIGWVSWAIQVLVATYYPSWSLLDQVVLVVGLSSIRLIRYLEGHRLKDKRRS